jgi:hypothetical protein
MVAHPDHGFGRGYQSAPTCAGLIVLRPQDNGSWGGPSATFDAAGIANDDWVLIGGGDGFFTQADPADPNTVYSNSQMNGLSRYDWRVSKSKAIRPVAGLTEPPFRFNWNSPIHISPHDSHTVYTGGHVLIKSTDRGITWEIISPDLTTNDPEKQKDSGGPITPDNSGAESHCTITTIAESPLERGLIWCGTDDGNLQLHGTEEPGRTSVALQGFPSHLVLKVKLRISTPGRLCGFRWPPDR